MPHGRCTVNAPRQASRGPVQLIRHCRLGVGAGCEGCARTRSAQALHSSTSRATTTMTVSVWRVYCALAAFACYVAPVLAGNRYPIILVHGFGGWSKSELGGYKYWGGKRDYEEELRAQGYDVHIANIGKLSSNWDRTCELFAQIKGGRVDYGANHSTTRGHNRYGETYTGLVPRWGEMVNGTIQKVHIVGHSMGGSTARMMSQLLLEGTKGAPIEEDPSSHPLFVGGHDWIHSITTISTPHQGATLADALSKNGDLVKDFVAALVVFLGVPGDGYTQFFDAKLDQWGVEPRKSSESSPAYLNRVLSSAVLKPGFKDIVLWSLSTAGANEEATWVKNHDSIYYYSYSNKDTVPFKNLFLQNVAVPRVFSMFALMQPFSTFIGGRYTVHNLGFPETWQANDGVANLASMAGDVNTPVVEFSGTSQTKRWQHMMTVDGADHLAIIGMKDVFTLYETHAALLYDMPSATSSPGKTILSSPGVLAKLATTKTKLRALVC